MMSDRIRMLVDNASLDHILVWTTVVRTRFIKGISTRRFVIHLAPETIAEMFSIGATSRAEKLQALSALALKVFNGRILNYHFWRILDEVRGKTSRPFLAAGMARTLLQNIQYFASGETPHENPEWFRQSSEMIRLEKDDDKAWRKEFQRMYRSRDRQNDPNPYGRSFDEFATTSTVRDLVLSRVDAICKEGAVSNSSIRASDLVSRGFALASHLYIRIARLWWYTESTREGRHASADLFDDALLNYVDKLDMIITPDRDLIAFGQTTFPEKRLLSPEAFSDEFL